MNATAWPAWTLARYLTVGGAIVDITDDSSIGRVTVTCRGCTWTDHYSTDGLVIDTAAQQAERVADTLPAARRPAQNHAETCRAMPKPEGKS